jgi:hypothetical protein
MPVIVCTSGSVNCFTEFVRINPGVKPGQPRPPGERKDQHRGFTNGRASNGSHYTAIYYGEALMPAGLGPSEIVGSRTGASAASQKHVPL